jgi:hypothetical protein
VAVIQKIFAYNTGSLISGTTQVGDIAISESNVEYSAKRTSYIVGKYQILNVRSCGDN